MRVNRLKRAITGAPAALTATGLVLAALAAGLVLAIPAQASSNGTVPTATGANVVTVVKQHFEYDLGDSSSGTPITYHFSCDETRVAGSNAAFESIFCRTNDYSHSRPVIFSPQHLFGGLYPWSSDFTGEPASDFFLVGTPSGLLVGWARYHT